MRVATLIAMLALLVAACSSDEPQPSSGSPTPAPEESAPEQQGESSTSPTPELTEMAEPPVEVELVLNPLVQLTAPVAVATRPGSDSILVAEQVGRVFELELGPDGRVSDEPREVLNITDRVQARGEQGLLGIAFSPEQGRLYATFTNPSGADSLLSWELDGNGIADPATELEHLEVFQPYANHNGGQLAFGPDGYLYYGLGDGGSGGDPEGNGQNRSTLLGSILRIDPDEENGGYTIPADNPFVDEPGAAPEIWAHGFRNPWRFSFDATTGDLWIADVGEQKIEEIDYLPAAEGAGRGANLGWNAFEGTVPFSGAAAPGHIPPLLEYERIEGRCSVIGGYVYRGTAIPQLDGVYLFSDWCDGVIRGVLPGVGSGPLLVAPSASVVSFGEGPDGELYVIEADGVVSRLEAQSS